MKLHKILVAGLPLVLFWTGCTAAGEPTFAPPTIVDSDLQGVPDELAFVEEDGGSLPESPPTVVGIAVAASAPESLDAKVVDPLEVALRVPSLVIVSDLLHDGLTDVDGETGRLRPGLATAWFTNDDFTEWQFELNAERVDAATVKSSLERVLASGGPAASMLGDVEGTEEFLLGERSGVDGFVVVDEETFVVRLRRPTAGLAWILSGLRYSVTSSDGATTGLFGLDGVAFESVDTRMTVLVAEGLQLEITWLSDVDPESQAAGVAETRFFVLNLLSPILGDSLVREAIFSIVDRELLGSDTERPSWSAFGVTGPAAIGYRAGACGGCDLTDDRAASLGVVVQSVEALTIGHVGSPAPAIEQLAEQLSDAGIEVSVVQLEADELVAAVSLGSVDIYDFGWVPVAGSIDSVVEAMFSSVSVTSPIAAGWSEVDILLDQARSTGTDEERWDLLRQAEGLVLSQYVVLPYATGSLISAELSDGTDLAIRPDGSLDLGFLAR